MSIFCSNELSIPFNSTLTGLCGGVNDAAGAPNLRTESRAVCIVSHLHLYESTSSTRVYLANRSYPSPAAGNSGVGHPMVCIYQSGGFPVVTLAALRIETCCRSAGLDQ